MKKDDLLERLTQAKTYFSGGIHLFHHILNCSAAINKLIDRKTNTVIQDIVAFVGFFAYGWYVGVPFAKNIIQGDQGAELLLFYETLMPDLAAMFVAPLTLLASFVLSYIFMWLLCKLGIYFIKRAIFQPKIDAETQKLKLAVDELGEYYRNYSSYNHIACPVPFERCHPQLIEELCALIATQRAETIDECLEVMEEDSNHPRRRREQKHMRKHMQQGYAFFDALSLSPQWERWNMFWVRPDEMDKENAV